VLGQFHSSRYSLLIPIATEFKEIRKEWKARKKEEEAARKAEEERQRMNGSRRIRSVADDDTAPPGGTYPPGVRPQLPPIAYQPGQPPHAQGQYPPGGMPEPMPQEYGRLYQNYPPSPYGQGNQMYPPRKHAATDAQRILLSSK
jgi:hypothetical protein